MAEKEIIVKLSVEGGDQAAKQIDQAAGATKTLAAGTTDANKALNTTAKELSSAATAAGDLNKTTTSLRGQLRQTQEALAKLALAGKANTEEYKKLREEAGKLQDAISDVSQEIRQAGSDTRGLDQTIRVATTAASAFGAVQAATALFGKENEELQRTLVKVTAAISLVQSLQQVQAELLRKDSVFTLAAAKAKELYAAATSAASRATNTFKLALAGLGIGLIIGGLTLLITNWDKLTKALGFAKKAQDDLNKSTEEANRQRKLSNDLVEAEIELLTALGAAEDVIIEKKLELAKSDLEIAKAQVQLEEGLQNVNKQLTQQFQLLQQFGGDQAAIQQFKDLQAAGFGAAEGIEEQSKASIEAQTALLRAEARVIGLQKALESLKNKARPAAKETVKAAQDIQKVFESFSTGLVSRVPNVIADLSRQVSSLSEQIEGLAPDDPRRFALVQTFIELQRELIKARQELDFLKQSFEAIDLVGPVIPDFVEEVRQQTLDAQQAFAQFFGQVAAQQKKIQDDQQRERLQRAQEEIQNAAFVGSQIVGIWAQVNQRQRSILENRLQQGLISEEQYERELRVLRLKEAKNQKASAFFDATVNGAAAVVSALKFGPAFAAIVGALVAAQLAAIIATPLPKFRKGGEVLEGMIRGRSHEAGGVHIEAEGGEYIVNKAVTMKYRPIVEALNAGDLSKVVQLSLPRLPRSSSGAPKIKDKRIDLMLEEMQYISAYIQQGNKYGREVAINSGKVLKNKRSRFHV
jgi:uncharacterized protein YukE